jgi:hypothetical protein
MIATQILSLTHGMRSIARVKKPLYYAYLYPGEIGIIFKTQEIDDRLAKLLAEKIVQRRSCKPFSSWSDFNSFIDELVERGIIEDTRRDEDFNLFTDPSGLWWLYLAEDPLQTKVIKYPSVYLKALYKRCASQAIGDVIKANANPNLHLNEINPDEALWQFVDKTDLIKNSTEFCFIPTGVFEIESQGLVLKPQRGFFDALSAPINSVRGRRKIITEVRLYQIYREAVQRDFYRGKFGNYRYISEDTNKHASP